MLAIASWLKRRGRLLQAKAYRYFYALPEVSIDELAPPLPEGVEPIVDHICLPPHHGTQGHDDLTPLLRIVSNLATRIVLEFGTGYGNLAANICALSDARVFTVNARPDQMSGDITTYSLAEEYIGCVYREYGFQGRVTQVYANTQDFDHTEYFQQPCVD
ncbi:MAG: hypothetical protein WBB22_05045, partial [Anaerolineae bacterium]